jgi:hypothetical protein
MTPGRRPRMPGGRDSVRPTKTDLEEEGGGRSPRDALAPPAELRAALRPWINLDEVGLPGLWVWLRTVVPMLPAPSSAEADPAGPHGTESGGSRVHDLAKALVDCARDRARLNFQSYEYYSDNTVLARRIRALEGMVIASGKGLPLPADPETDRAVERYLPRADRGSGRDP